MASNPSPQMEFPQNLELVPEGTIVHESFGWAPAAWAVALLGVPSVVFVQPAKPRVSDYTFACGVMLVGALLLWWEFWRRVRPRSLVRFGLGTHLGVYRHGVLDQIMPIDNVRLFLRHPGKTWGAILYSVMCAAVCIAVLVTSLTGGPALGSGARLLIGTGSLFFSALFGSVIRSRLFCEELIFPRKGPRGMHHLLVRKSAIPKLLSRE